MLCLNFFFIITGEMKPVEKPAKKETPNRPDIGPDGRPCQKIYYYKRGTCQNKLCESRCDKMHGQGTNGRGSVGFCFTEQTECRCRFFCPS